MAKNEEKNPLDQTLSFNKNADVEFREWPRHLYHRNGAVATFASPEDVPEGERHDWKHDPVEWQSGADTNLRGRMITGSGDIRLRYPGVDAMEVRAQAAPARSGIGEGDQDVQRFALVNAPVRDPQREEASKSKSPKADKADDETFERKPGQPSRTKVAEQAPEVKPAA